MYYAVRRGKGAQIKVCFFHSLGSIFSLAMWTDPAVRGTQHMKQQGDRKRWKGEKEIAVFFPHSLSLPTPPSQDSGRSSFKVPS